MSDCENGDVEHKTENQSDWSKELELIKKLEIENAIMKANFDHMISNINSSKETIDKLVGEYYATMKDNNRMILRIMEEIDSINQILTARSKKNE